MNTSFEQITEKKTLAEMRSDEIGVVTKLRGSAGTQGIFRYLGISLDASIVRIGTADGAPDDYDIHVKVGDKISSLNRELARNVQVSVQRVRNTVDVNKLIERRHMTTMELVR
jgi:Fe2+ transport system protein FeoA